MKALWNIGRENEISEDEFILLCHIEETKKGMQSEAKAAIEKIQNFADSIRRMHGYSRYGNGRHEYQGEDNSNAPQ